VERIHRVPCGQGDQALAEALSEADRLQEILRELRVVVIHRALAAWDRSTETFGEEIVALNDIDEALGNLHRSG
jgi:L-ascorbate metabolism protein UlaG (beta-lactamase superfamily)